VKIHHSQPASAWAKIPNATLRDPQLSYLARGVLAELLSHTEDWSTNADAIWQRARRERGKDAEGHRAIRAAFAELQACGYLRRVRKHGDGGQIVTELHIYDVPAGRTDDTPSVMPVPPAQTDVSADHADVTDGATSAPPGQTGIPAGRTDDTVTDMSVGRPSVNRHVGERAVSTKTDYGNQLPRPEHEDRRSSAAPPPSLRDDDGSANPGTARSTPQAPLPDSNHSTGSRPDPAPAPHECDGTDDQGCADGYLGAHRRPAEAQP
jgi:hypothetical protein